MTELLSWGISKAPYFGIVGAAIALGSWAITNMIADRLRSAKSAHERAATIDELRQRLGAIRRGYREVKATVSRLDLMISEINPASIFSVFPKDSDQESRRTYALLQTAEPSFFEHEDLQEIILAVEKLSSTTEIPRNLATEVDKAVGDSKQLLAKYRTASRVWDEERRRSIELIKSGQVDNTLFQRATSEYVKAAAPLHDQFNEHRQRLLPLYGRIEGHLESRLKRLRRAHRFWERASWFLYALGASLAIAGKWIELGT
jgi:hypothetical protein